MDEPKSNKVIAMPGVTLPDGSTLPDFLRQIATDIEAGRFTANKAVVCLLYQDDGAVYDTRIAMFSIKPSEAITLLELEKQTIVHLLL